ncbi:MAG: metalloregulator ArsR/SmtB family transcription factor [Verrucomicrobiota bacterium]
MPAQRKSNLDLVFFALSDPTRRAIVRQLVKGPSSVGELSEPFRDEMTPPAISRHLRVLESAQLISQERVGKQRICTFVNKPVSIVTDFLDELENEPQ